jgi:hypothetical protein
MQFASLKLVYVVLGVVVLGSGPLLAEASLLDPCAAPVAGARVGGKQTAEGRVLSASWPAANHLTSIATGGCLPNRSGPHSRSQRQLDIAANLSGQ